MPSPRALEITEKRLIVLGSAGSIGTQTLEVVEHLNALADQGRSPVRLRIVGLATGRNAKTLAAQASRLGVKDLAIADEDGGAPMPTGARVRRGPTAAEDLVQEVECDVVLGAMVGSAGLPATLTAIRLGRDVALANKETLVAAGELVVPAARASGSRLLPVDSEHCAVWQCLQGTGRRARGTGPLQAECPPLTCGPEVSRVVLTASGGPFRTASASDTYNATPRQALNHPTWNMGPKVTIDSASLTNKALEIVEAHWLFGLPGDRIGVVVHPQSIVHALVEFADGNIIAQLAPPDMRTPIQYALTFPHRPESVSRKLDWSALRGLEFSEPDRQRFPALDAAYRIIAHGGTSGAVFNAANEAAVEAFLAEQIPFGRITELALGATETLGHSPIRDLADVTGADEEARRWVRSSIAESPRSAARPSAVPLP